MSMTSQDVPDGATEVEIEDVREGERLVIQYLSSQSRNLVEYEGVVKEADRLGTRTSSIIFAAENGTNYDINRHCYVRSTGEKNRRLSEGRADIYRLEGLDIESWDDEITCGGLHIYREKDEVFDCPFCGADDSASVNSVNDGNVTISCGNCREVKVVDDQPVTMALKVTR